MGRFLLLLLFVCISLARPGLHGVAGWRPALHNAYGASVDMIRRVSDVHND